MFRQQMKRVWSFHVPGVTAINSDWVVGL